MIDKIKNVAIVALVVLALVVAWGAWRYFSAWSGAEAKAAAAETAKKALEEERTKLLANVADLTAEQLKRDALIDGDKKKISDFEQQIVSLNQELVRANQTKLEETADQTIAKDFMTAFGLTEANVKVVRYTEVAPRSGRTFTNSFLAIPVDVAKLPTISKNTEVACKAEVGLRENIDALKDDINTLTLQKLDLERQKAQAWSEGYDKAYTMYVDINKLYVDLLKSPPKVDLGPRWLALVGGLLGGAALCKL